MPQRDFPPPVIECCIVKEADETDETDENSPEPNTAPGAGPDRKHQQRLPRRNAVVADVTIVQSTLALPEVLPPSAEALEADRPLPPSDHTDLIDGLLFKPVG